MNRLAALGVVASVFVLLPALVAQDGKPRFVLPEVPYDYAPVAAPGLAARFSLPARNGAGAPRGCGVAPDAPAPPPERTNELATLGRVLFHDRLLSRNESRSCSSCHEQGRAFADGETGSLGFRGQRTHRNSMSIANLGLLGTGFFWDARATTLEQAVLLPIRNPIEMGMEVPDVIARLRVEPGYADLFTAAFGDARIDERRLAVALAQFVRSLVSLRSRYDEGLAATGDVNAPFPNFTPAENRGKHLFFGAGGARERSCAGCHVERVYLQCGHTFELDPVALQSSGCRNNGVDAGRGTDDPGLAAVSGQREDLGKFRAPSLRNIELTAPYMHDGRFATLEQVVQFYSGRVRAHANLDPVLRHDAHAPSAWGRPAEAPLVTGPSRAVLPLQTGVPMDSRERSDLVAFLKTLTDWHFVRDPRFADPFVRPKMP